MTTISLWESLAFEKKSVSNFAKKTAFKIEPRAFQTIKREIKSLEHECLNI